MTKFLLHGFEILLALQVWMNPGCLHAEQVDRTIGQFVHTSWSAKDGAPGDVYALAQTTDGFLWLGTMQGLYRFDGITFERYEPQSGPAFPSSTIMSLLALPNGDLWIGFLDEGVSRLREGRNTNYANADGLPLGIVFSLAQDREGVIWAGSNTGLARFDHDQWKRVGNDWGYPGGKTMALFVDRHGTLWVASEKAVFFLPPGSRKLQPAGVEIGHTRQIIESGGGALWLAETTRSVHPLSLPANQHSLEPEIRVGSTGILFDNDGSLWITSLGDGMRRVPFPDRLDGRKISEFSRAIESFTAKDGLTSDYAVSILKDREGDIWVGTSAGLDRFRRGVLVPILSPARFTLKTLVAGDDGDIWMGGVSGALARIEGNTLKDIRSSTGIENGLRDSRGSIWFVDAGHEVFRLKRGKLTAVAKTSASIHDAWLGTVLAADRLGTLWVGNGARSLLVLKKGRWERFETPPAVAEKRARVTFTDANGRVWFGFTDNTILVIDGPNVRTFSAKDGIQVGSVIAITGQGGHIWVGGKGGLAIWEGDRFRTVVPADSDAFHSVSGVQENSGGDLFLSEQRGVVFISATEISKILKDPSARVQYQVFDVHDGLPGPVQQTSPYPTTVQGTDGRTWFSTSAGVAWIDPAHIPRNLLPPPVVIRSITANGVRYSSSAGLKLLPRTRDLTIDYTALSLAIPERVRFRYKLEGSDAQWQDAGGRRQAFYTNLSPGQYQFRVIASNNDGVWNEEGAYLDFNIAFAWYQTIWLRLLYVAAFLAVLWGLYQLRVQQVRGEERKLREAIETIPAMAWIAGPDGAVQFRNRRWVEYTGLSELGKAEGVGTVAVHPEDRDRIVRRLGASFASGEPFEEEMRIRRTDGEYRWFLCRAVPLRDKRGKVMKWYGAATDIEDRKNAEQLRADFAHASRVSTMGELVASISHELAQPITVTTAHAKASLQWLQRDPPNLTEVRKGMERIVEAGTLASEIINRLRSLYKKTPPKRELVAINEVIGEMARMLGSEARRHGVSICTDIEDDLPMTVADRVQLQQVLMNLILNGIEAITDTGGVVTVKSRSGKDGQIEISVNDTGPGLPLGKADQIFDAFFTTKPQGSGMGLAISKSIVESHGGRIWANGDGGRGATFHFSLPAAPAETSPPADAA
jgi:PAS domain S-box-containing protein